MRKSIFCIIILLAVFVGISKFTLASGENNELYFVKSNNNYITLIGLQNNKVIQYIQTYSVDYDVYKSKIVYFSKKNRDLYVKIYDTTTKNDNSILKLRMGKQCNDPEWLDGQNIALSYRDEANGFSRHKINIYDLKNQIISVKYEEDSMVYKMFYKKQDLCIVKSDPLYERGFFEVVKDGKLIYKSEDGCYRPDFKNNRQVSFLKNGNLYIYDLKTQNKVRYTDFPEDKWNPIEINGYYRYSWRDDGALAIEYMSPESGGFKGVKVYSSSKELIKEISNSYNPKWPKVL